MNADRILLVEDDERIGSALVRALEGNGFDVRWTRAGEDAVTTVEVRRPDLVLLDLGLPDMDGLEVCRRIHAADPTIDVIMLVADAAIQTTTVKDNHRQEGRRRPRDR